MTREFTTIGPRRGLFLLLAALALAGASCGPEAARERVIVLGLDGVDPEVVALLVSEGKLPNFATLQRDGAYAKLRSSLPLLSPILWTTIATGKPPDQHGIGHFVAVNEQTGEQLPVTSHMRRTKALWNVLSDHKRTVAVVGWWATWPAETVNGTIVSDHTCYHFLFPEGQSGAADPLGIVHPPELAPVIQGLVRRPGTLTPADLEPFVSVSQAEFDRPFAFDNDLGHFKWLLATSESYARIGLHLWKEQAPDVLMVYIEGVDSTSHLFGHLFRAGDLAGELAQQQARYGRAVEEMYRYADGILGDYMQAMDEGTTLVVLSDHGFELGVLHDDPSHTRDMRRVSERFHRIEGILYLYGNRVRKGRGIERPTQLDITPTLLALAGVAPAQDMPGRVLEEAVDLPRLERRLASFESEPSGQGEAARDARVDAAILERLEQLGYLDAESPKGDRNLAGSLFEAGRHAEAAQAYAVLLAEEPDDAALRASYGGVLGALGRYDEALEQLDKAIELEPLNAEAYHNRGLIHERRGEREAAVAEYRSALRYQPDYPPPRAALRRLTGSAETGGAQTPPERLAALLAQRASEAARRGDYEAAMKQLDEAQRIAPRLALVYQYRSNVAFLRGDREAAIAALEKALELEPDNALFRTNLERLRRTESD